MVNADLMDAIDRALRQARGRKAEPFGGAQVVMFGDPYQLAPVPPRGDEAHYIRDHYRSFWFFDAKVWVGEAARRRPHRRRLVRRRAAHPRAGRHPSAGGSGVQGDAERRAARTGDGRHRADLQRHGRPHAARTRSTASTRSSRWRRATTSSTRSTGGTSTRSPAARRRPSPRSPATSGGGMPPTPPIVELQLKVGAQVMFLRNDTGSFGEPPRWVNGTIGTVTRIAGGTVRVDVERRRVRRRAGRLGEVPLRVRRRLEVADAARSWPSSRSSRCGSPGR